ncbi:hypothetical protein KSP40_PGU003491 [Platanthera guangdongensis]|uniref:Glucose-6-phosphate isomerase n=1 Tax=Platanthera guangdongensis TaxID=2320717 RepID=A0ABR2M6I9_9ASPA
MASTQGIYSSSSNVKTRRSLLDAKLSRREPSFVPVSPACRPVCPAKSVARDTPPGLSPISNSPHSMATTPEKDPISLWNRYVDWLYQHKDLGLYLDVSRIGFPDGFFEKMDSKMQRALAAMQELEMGAIANPDEGRMVGHYWLRNPSLAPNSSLRLQIEKTLDSVCEFANKIISAEIKPPSSPHGRFTQILSIGIGGSALGPQFVAEALAPDNPPLKVRFIDNTDPAGIDHQIAQLGPELASTLVIVISKSGGTPETRNGLLEVQKAFRDAGLEFSKQGVAITQENSLLDNTARIERWLARFPMFDWVGGRTSVMSAVGLLPAALQGIDIREMLVGASLMDEANRKIVVKNNPAALLALCWYWATDGVGSKDMVVLPYKDSLLLFSRYLQQLVMESLGKELDLDGNRGTRSALYSNDRESITVTVQEVNPRSVGALIALYERAVGLYAYLVNINAYHQPGVEAGKKAAGEILALQKRVLAILNEARCVAAESVLRPPRYCFFDNIEQKIAFDADFQQPFSGSDDCLLQQRFFFAPLLLYLSPPSSLSLLSIVASLLSVSFITMTSPTPLRYVLMLMNGDVSLDAFIVSVLLLNAESCTHPSFSYRPYAFPLPSQSSLL